MISETIDIATADGIADTYVTRPEEGEHPPVLFYVDAIGLRPRIEEMADRIAGWGYTVLAPNVFYRAGVAADLAPTTDLRVPGNREAFFATAGSRIGRLTTEMIMRDADTYLQTLLGQVGVSGDQVGITGYCLGGRLSFLTACEFPDTIVAASGFHAAALVTEEADSPHLQADRARAELYFGHADNDRSMTAEAIETFNTALDEAGLHYISTVYPGAQHGYTMTDTSVYDEQATERHFGALQDLFARNLG